MPQLTPHFHTEEFRCRDGTPLPKHARPDARALCERYLEPLRERFGVTAIISGFRTPAHNAKVKGAPNSFHIARRDRKGIAADVICASGTPEEWADLLDELDVPGLGRYSTHAHADNRDGHARWRG